MDDTTGYAVFLFPQALEALGEAIKPYLLEGAGGTHVLCREIDTGGAFIEMALDGVDGEGKPVKLELMIPSAMVRMIVSVRSDELFGFVPRIAKMVMPALAAVGSTAAAIDAQHTGELPAPPVPDTPETKPAKQPAQP